MDDPHELPVVILGCGESINALSPEERAFLNRCDASIGLNKFMAFSDLAQIRPTHVFFADSFSASCDVYLQLIFDLCRRARINGVTFVLDKALAPSCADSRLMRRVLLRRKRRECEPAGGVITTPDQRLSVLLLPPACRCEFVEQTDWLRGEEWATTLDEKLFHHRGSLTAALNYAAIVWPGRDILLVGTDFNSAKYFFEESELYRKIEVRDWTYDLVRSADRHFSAIEYQGMTIFESFGFITDKLRETGNRLYCANEKSLLVEYGCVPFRKLGSTADRHRR